MNNYISQFRNIKLIIWLFLFICYGFQLPIFAQSNVVEKLGDGASFLANGVLNGRYKKPGWNEFIMPHRLEIGGSRIIRPQSHPRLVNISGFTRISQSSPESARWVQLIRQAANQPVSGNYPRVKSWSPVAKAAAFMYKSERQPIYLQKVIDFFKQLPEPPEIVDFEGGTADIDWGDFLQSTEPIPDLCVAYDLLYGDLPVAVRQEFERKIIGVSETLIDGLKYTPKNNHVTVMSIAIATTALSVENINQYSHYTANEMHNLALEYLSESLGLIAPDGGYAEGPYYARYILNYLAPFSIHLKNVTGIDLFDHPQLRRMVNWVFDNEKSSGNFTQFDDAFTTHFFFLPLILAKTEAENDWQQYRNMDSQFTNYQPNMVEAVLLPMNLVQNNLQFKLHYPGKFYPDMGQAIFRDKSAQPDFFTSLLFEQEEYFADVHEQTDPLAIEISAFGKDFIIDGGYGDGTADADRPFFLSQQSNSSVLIDGLGTNPNPLSGDNPFAQLDFAFSTPHFAAASVSQKIGDADIRAQYVLSR